MIREAVSCSVVPMLMGDNKSSRRLARRLFWRFSLRSNIFDSQASSALRFMLSAKFRPLPEQGDEFTLMSIERFAYERDGMTFLLIPCTRKARDFVERNRSDLENKFIIRSPKAMNRSLREGEIPYDIT